MKKVGIFYGSTTGATEGVAETIAARLGVASEDIHNVGTTKVDEVDKYDVLLLGSSTWGIGELQDDWNDFLDKRKAKNLSGTTVAIFGCGDSASFGGSFCDAIGIIYNELQGSGCQFAGSVDTDGYSYDSSEACVDGQFVGLPLDESNESDQTDKRIDAWISGLKQVIC